MPKIVGETLSLKDIAKDIRGKFADNGKSISMTESVMLVHIVLDSIIDNLSKDEISGICFKDFFSLNKYIRAGRKGTVNNISFVSDDKLYIKFSESKKLGKKLNS